MHLIGRAFWTPAYWLVAPELCYGRTSGGAAACRLVLLRALEGSPLFTQVVGRHLPQGSEDSGSHGGSCSSALSPVSELVLPSCWVSPPWCGGAGFELEG